MPRLRPSGSKRVAAPDRFAKLRYRALLRSGGACQCCGARASANNPLHVDHIKPRTTHPELYENEDNLQVLCSLCNWGKGTFDHTDWRKTVIKSS